MKKIIIVLLFVVAALFIVIQKRHTAKSTDSTVTATTSTQKPRLLELGSHSCIPCKMMMPILDTLREKHEGTLQVEFIDIWKDRSAGSKYGVSTIPTQILFAADGKELMRHEGYWSRQDLEKTMVDLGMISKGAL